MLLPRHEFLSSVHHSPHSSLSEHQPATLQLAVHLLNLNCGPRPEWSCLENANSSLRLCSLFSWSRIISSSSCFLAVTSCYLAVTSCYLAVTSCYLAVTSCYLAVTSCFLAVTSCYLAVTSCFLAVTSCISSTFTCWCSLLHLFSNCFLWLVAS